VAETAIPVASPSRRPHKRVGPYSKRGALAMMDGRSREALFMRARRHELTAHIGGSPTVVQAALIERCAWLSLRVALLDEKMVASELTDHDNRAYLARSNSLARALKLLGVKGVEARPPTLQEALAAGRVG